uniref:Uncharacterized protein n=1 Tax=Glossina austeni TaxID=7395 RepID=A0A1A9V103_GLOAU
MSLRVTENKIHFQILRIHFDLLIAFFAPQRGVHFENELFTEYLMKGKCFIKLNVNVPYQQYMSSLNYFPTNIFAAEMLQTRDTAEDISKPQIALDYTFLMKVKSQIKQSNEGKILYSTLHNIVKENYPVGSLRNRSRIQALVLARSLAFANGSEIENS